MIRPELLLSFGSGIAALIYEIVWFQLLELVVGSTAVSLAIVLATFMGGMCVGSLMLPRVVSSRHPTLRVYAAIELGIGLCAGVVLLLMPFVHGVFMATLCLLPPTLLMGATMPLLARQVRDVSPMGLMYAANIAGGVIGCLLAGFYLLRQYDVAAATYVAFAINVAMAGIALALKGTVRSGPTRPQSEITRTDLQTVHIAIALSGLCALGSEAIWTRTFSLLLGATVYTFSIILAVFLAGLGIGGGIGALLCRMNASPRAALGWCQLSSGAAMAWTAHSISASLPYWPIDPSISSSIWFNFELDLARAIWALLPATILWGASFPLALAAAAEEREASRLFAGIYAANTIGAIAGVLVVSLILIGWIGSQRAQQVLVAVSVMAGVLLLPRSWILAASLGALSVYSVPPISKLLIAYGRYAATWVGKSDILYAAEGINSSVAVASFPNGALTFHVAGKIQASNVPRDMRLQRMLGHLTTLTAHQPASVLVIGCGAGVTAGAVSIDPRVQEETIVELEPLVPEAAWKYFSGVNFKVLRDPKVRLHIADGRQYLLTTKEKFDGITVDPLDPWVKGAADLYTREFLEVMKQHLNPGGTVTMYIQLFETTEDAVKSALATFFDVFPNGTIWGNPYNGQGHDLVLLGQAEPSRIDLDEMEQRVGYREDSKMSQSLAEIGMNSPVDLFATYAGRASDLKPWLAGAAINRDRNLRMQYLAGIGLNADYSAAIYAAMLAYRRFPDDVFTSAEGRVDSLREAMRRAQ